MQARLKYIEGASATVTLLKLAGPATPVGRACRSGIDSSVAGLLAAADEFSKMQYSKNGGGFRLCSSGKAVALRCQRLCCRLLRILDTHTSSCHGQKRLYTREMAIGLSKADYGEHAVDEDVFENDEKASAKTFLFPLGYPVDFFRYS